MCPLPPAHMSLIRKDSWTLTFFIFIQFLHLLFLWLSIKHFLIHDVFARSMERISFSLFLLVLIISISTHLFIHLNYYPKEEEKRKIIQNIYIHYVHCEKYKEKKNFFYIVREENIWPQVPTFFRGKKISYRIFKLLFTA